MILDDFIVKTSIGYYCKYADVYLDPSQAVEHAIVSHAHADHACAGSKEVYCTEATAAFMQLRYKNRAAKNFHIYQHHQSFSIADVKFSFVSAGHILGSVQILMEYQNIRYLYSGDIKLQEDKTVAKAELVPADVLITETTFAQPHYIHPNAENELERIINTDGPVVIGSYVLGKAQRINSIINTIAPQIPVNIHFDIYPYHKIYERLGSCALNYSIMQKKDIRKGQPGIYIVPPLTYQTYQHLYPYTFAFASGWEKLQSSQLSLRISDHMDWNELQQYIEQVNPKEIWAIHGDASYLQEHFAENTVRVKVL